MKLKDVVGRLIYVKNVTLHLCKYGKVTDDKTCIVDVVDGEVVLKPFCKIDGTLYLNGYLLQYLRPREVEDLLSGKKVEIVEYVENNLLPKDFDKLTLVTCTPPKEIYEKHGIGVDDVLKVVQNRLINELLEVCGTTYKLEEAIFMLPNGKLINGYAHGYVMDHSEFPYYEINFDYLKSAVELMCPYDCRYKLEWYLYVTGCLRLRCSEYAYAERLELDVCAVRPLTSAQIKSLIFYIEQYNPVVYVDLYTLKDCQFVYLNLQYPAEEFECLEGAKAKRLISKINDYWR